MAKEKVVKKEKIVKVVDPILETTVEEESIEDPVIEEQEGVEYIANVDEETIQALIEESTPEVKKEDESLDELIKKAESNADTIIDTTVIEDENNIEGVEQLSPSALKWKAWLKVHGITPERFLEKYKNHVSRKYVEELVKNK